MTRACRMVGCMSPAAPGARFCAPCAADWVSMLGDDLMTWGFGTARPQEEVVAMRT